jgi:hypothetical protein
MRAVQRPEEEPGNQTKPGDDAGRPAAQVWVGSAEQITRHVGRREAKCERTSPSAAAYREPGYSP